MLEFFLDNILLVYVLELLSAVSGSFYLWKSPDPGKNERLLVYYLWFMVFIETFGMYPLYAYFNNYETLGFIKNTPFERNYWLFNSFNVVSFLVYFTYFIQELKRERTKKLLQFITFIFVVSALLNLVFSEVFFKAYAAFTVIFGTFILVTIISAYYYEMLTSNKILNFHQRIGFYISVGSLLWHLVVTPIFIYSHYFTMDSPEFVAFHALVLKTANIFMYSCFIIGFLICFRKNNYYLSSIS